MKALHLTVAAALLRQASALIQGAPECAADAQACCVIDSAIDTALETLLAVESESEETPS